jgi:hypothetical protein
MSPAAILKRFPKHRNIKHLENGLHRHATHVLLQYTSTGGYVKNPSQQHRFGEGVVADLADEVAGLARVLVADAPLAVDGDGAALQSPWDETELDHAQDTEQERSRERGEPRLLPYP